VSNHRQKAANDSVREASVGTLWQWSASIIRFCLRSITFPPVPVFFSDASTIHGKNWPPLCRSAGSYGRFSSGPGSPCNIEPAFKSLMTLLKGMAWFFKCDHDFSVGLFSVYDEIRPRVK
jgi:hypothetical protein